MGSTIENWSAKVPFVVATNWAWIRSGVTVYFMKPWVGLMFDPIRVTKSPASVSCGFIGRRAIPRVPETTTIGPAPLV